MFKQKICFDIWGGEAGKYRLFDNEGNAVDTTPQDTCSRVARALANVEMYPEQWFDKFNNIIGTKFAGGGRIMANAGSKKYKKEVSLINCVVSSQLADSMEALMDIAKEAALILKAGCGIGYDFSPLRPKGARVYGAGAGTSGVISFMKVFDTICSTILSGGGRRGSQLGALDIQHPDVEEFITAKRQDGVLRYFNISILITDQFMHAVQNKEKWDLWFWEKIRNGFVPNSEDVKIIKKNDIPFRYPDFKYFKFASDHTEVVYKNCTDTDIFSKRIYKTIDAADLFEKITKSTYTFNDPGFLLIDKVNHENNLWFTETIRTSNPCVTGDTRLHTNLGLVTVKELYDSQASIQCTVDNRTLHEHLNEETMGVSIKEALPIFKTSDNAQIFKITTKAGYEIKATKWHKFYTQKGKIELKDLQVGDTLYTQSGVGQFGSQGSYELGFVYGMLVGDGHFKKDKGAWSTVISLWDNDRSLSDKLENYIKILVNDVETFNTNNRHYEQHFYAIEDRNEIRLGSILLARKLIALGVNPENKYQLPNFIWQGNKECVSGFLQGLFQSDGHVDYQQKHHCEIRLNSSDPDLLKDIQILLSNFGIFASIYLRRKEHDKMMPNGKNGQQLYHCKNNYEIIISAGSRDLFMKYIGFASSYKTNKYDIFTKESQRIKTQWFSTTISSIEYVNNEPVYDTTQNDHHSLIFNGILTGNCGEQVLGPQSNCLLGSMILPAYVNNAFTNEASFDWVQYIQDVRIANRALDNVVEINNLPLKALNDNLQFQRRHGLGFTGLGSALNMLKISYGSKDSIKFAEKIMLTMAQASLLENIDVAAEKGCAPAFATLENRRYFMQSGYMKRLLDTFENKDKIIAQIETIGIRWSHATSIAPTGTMSLTWGNNCSNGIEPIFANSYLRNIRVQGKKTKIQEEVFDYAYFEWKQKHGDKPVPSYWRTTDNLNIDDHINVQSVVQKWCDASISKTINVPTDYLYDDFKNVYFNAWKNGLKGVTTFRFNPEIVSGVLVQKRDLDNTEYIFILEDGSEVSAKGSDTIMYDGEEHVAANLFDALKDGLYGNM